MTGNMIFMANELVENGVGPAAGVRALMIVSSVCGVMLLFALKKCFPNSYIRACALMCPVLLLISDVLNATLGLSQWHAPFLAASFAANNFLAFTLLKTFTTLATGALQKLAKGLFAIITRDTVNWEQFGLACGVVCATITGATIGGCVLRFEVSENWLLVIPAALQCILLLWLDRAVAATERLKAVPVGLADPVLNL